MTLPIERFKEAYANWRYNPFSAADMAVDATEDGLFIPGGSPFIIQLLELPRHNDPTSVLVRCYGQKTDVDQDSSSGQMVLYVASTIGFSSADTIIIDRGGTREEERVIDTVQAGVSLTVTVNLTYTHTAVQADDVEKYIAFTETAGAPAQSQYRVDYPPEDGEGTGLVEFNQNDATKEVRIKYKATGAPILEEYLNTKISYPADTPGDNQFVGFSSGAPIWRDFPHVLAGGEHTASGLTIGHVIRASGAAAFAWAQLGHGDLGSVSANQHHAQAHSLASHSSKAHNELTGIGANDHHAQAHSHAHSSITGVSADQHHAQVHAMGSHSDFSSYLDQAVKTTSNPTFNNLKVALCQLKDTGGDHYINLKCTENLSTNRGLNFIVGNDSRTVTFSGNPTLADWFNQSVKTTATPSFPHLNLTNAASKLQGGTALYLEAGASGVRSQTIYDDTTAVDANVHISVSTVQLKRFTSSIKYKDNVRNLELNSSKIHDLRPVSFNSKCKGDDKNRGFIGLIAEEVEAIFPEIILYGKNNAAESYDKQMLMTLMLKEIQNLNTRIKQLEN